MTLHLINELILKIKLAVRILVIFICLISCSQTNVNTDLIGHWKSTKSANVVTIEFLKDSVIYQAWEKTTIFSWSCDDNNIYYTQLTNINQELGTDFIMEYRVNPEKDTLFLKTDDSDYINEFVQVYE